MKRTIIALLSFLLAATMLYSCDTVEDEGIIYEKREKAEEVAVEKEPEVVREYYLPDDYRTKLDMMEGFWEYTPENNPGKKAIKYSGGYRFNADGTLDLVFERAYEFVGTYSLSEDNIVSNTYEPDSIMVLKSITETEMIVAFGNNELYLEKVTDAELVPFEEWMMTLDPVEQAELIAEAKKRFKSTIVDAANEVMAGVKVE